MENNVDSPNGVRSPGQECSKLASGFVRPSQFAAAFTRESAFPGDQRKEAIGREGLENIRTIQGSAASGEEGKKCRAEGNQSESERTGLQTEPLDFEKTVTSKEKGTNQNWKNRFT
jgi:hypothetical protein